MVAKAGIGLKRLMEKIYRERGFDFREYRESTLARRLERRLHARGAKTYADYAGTLDKDPSEYDKLFDDLTINVTSFFRDEVAFSALEEIVLPQLIKNRSNREKTLKIWSAGCATGQEPYSIAILLLEMLGEKISSWNIVIMATDIDSKALEKARHGVFPRNEVEGIRYQWRRKYFISKPDNFTIKPKVKRLVTFSEYNLINEPPYSDFNLIVCRNVLIYFSQPLQMRVLRNFYDTLKTGGYLLLGKAEVPSGESDILFKCINRKAKLYKKGSLRKKIQDEDKNTGKRLWLNVPRVKI